MPVRLITRNTNLGCCHTCQGPGFPVAEEALNAYFATEFESPQLVAYAQNITVDCHFLSSDVE
jgi:hypothetical protein